MQNSKAEEKYSMRIQTYGEYKPYKRAEMSYTRNPVNELRGSVEHCVGLTEISKYLQQILI